jgi:hypothetical protein
VGGSVVERSTEMNANRDVFSGGGRFRYIYTTLGLVVGIALGILLYALTAQAAYLFITVAFGVVAGSGVDQGYEREYPVEDPFK